MIDRRVSGNLIGNAILGALLCAWLVGCTATPKSLSKAPMATDPMAEAPMPQRPESGCDEPDCEEDEDGSRYQYYLGILSVFILG